jgi:hypothetical protein
VHGQEVAFNAIRCGVHTDAATDISRQEPALRNNVIWNTLLVIELRHRCSPPITAILHARSKVRECSGIHSRILSRVRWCCNRDPLLARTGAALSGTFICARICQAVYTMQDAAGRSHRHQSGSSTATVILLPSRSRERARDQTQTVEGSRVLQSACTPRSVRRAAGGAAGNQMLLGGSAHLPGVRSSAEHRAADARFELGRQVRLEGAGFRAVWVRDRCRAQAPLLVL